jgi:glucosylglycerate synthase
MAKLELSEETKTGMEAVGAADLLIAVAGQVAADQLRTAATQSVLGLSLMGPDAADHSSLRTVVAFPGVSNVESGVKDEIERDPAATGGNLRFLPYSLPPGAASMIPWIAPASTYQTVFAMARELGVSACAVISFDLAALQTNFLGPMLAPVLEKRCELAMPLYALGKFDGLLNSSILAPLTRALYGKRVRFPLAPDFCLSAKMLPELEVALQRTTAQGQDLFWPASEAAMRDNRVCQVHVDIKHLPPAEGVDLSTILAQTVGPLFAEMATNAPLWQRVRGSQPVDTLGTPVAPPADGHPADTTPMLETFQLGFRNLQEVWSLVLPPVTLLELKRLARVSVDRFHMPDDLWVRIVCDFALAHRLRTLSRTHLLGALTPLYLGWVASYALEVGSASPVETEQRLEKLARAYEEGKPYLLSRWRWPDRFNP